MNTNTNGTNGKGVDLSDSAALIAAMLPGEAMETEPAAETATGDQGEEGQETNETEAGSLESAGSEAAPLEEGDVEAAVETTAEETTETEEGEETTEGADATDGEDAELKGLPGNWQERVNKRIAKEVGKRKELAEERDQIKRELEEVRAEKSADYAAAIKGSAVDPVAMNPKVQTYRKEQEKFLGTAGAAEALLGKLESDPEFGLAELKKAGMNFADADAAMAQLKGLREQAVAAADRVGFRAEVIADEVRAGLEARRGQFDAEADRVYPWLKDAKSIERQRFDATLAEVPWMKALPAYRLALADMVAGAAMREAKAKARAANDKGQNPNDKGNPKPNGNGKPVVTAGRAVARPSSVGGNGKEALRRQAMKDPGNEETRVAALASYLD